MRAPLTLGTAGHIDHGKTALVRALTGKDTDRLPDEHRRGISIELGYAQLELPSGRRLSVVDVPGHERFVRTMVAGATGVDLFLLCVAADDGVMPQTREHATILHHLGVSSGVVAITKADLLDPAPAADEAAGLVPGAAVVPVCAPRGEGLGELLAALERLAASVRGRSGADGPALLHLDRSFTLRGLGTIVTGTLWEGSVAAGDTVRVEPQGMEARVRSVHVHDTPVERAQAGQRVALNLAGVDWRDVGRGDVACGPGSEAWPTYRIDATLELAEGARPLRTGERVQLHHGTRESPARVVPVAEGMAQLRLDAPIVPRPGDRVILRRPARFETLGSAVVLDPAPRRHGADPTIAERLARIAAGEPPGAEPPLAEVAAPAPARADPPPLDDAALALAAMLRADGERPRADGDLAQAAGLDPGEAAKRLNRLERAGLAVRVAGNLHYDPGVLDGLVARIAEICERDGGATLAGVRDELDTTRRYAQALLEHMDAAKVTVRRGDAHFLRRR